MAQPRATKEKCLEAAGEGAKSGAFWGAVAATGPVGAFIASAVGAWEGGKSIVNLGGELIDFSEARGEEEQAIANKKAQQLGPQRAISEAMAACDYRQAAIIARQLLQQPEQPAWLPTILPGLAKGAQAQGQVEPLLEQVRSTPDRRLKARLLEQATNAANGVPCLQAKIQDERDAIAALNAPRPPDPPSPPARPAEKCSIYSLNLSGPSIWVGTESQRLKSQASGYALGGDGHKDPPQVLGIVGTYPDCQDAVAAWCKMAKAAPVQSGYWSTTMQIGGTWQLLPNAPDCPASTTAAHADVATAPVTALKQQVLAPVNPPRLLPPPVLPPPVVHVSPPATTHPGPTTIIDRWTPPALSQPGGTSSATPPNPCSRLTPASVPATLPPRLLPPPVLPPPVVARVPIIDPLPRLPPPVVARVPTIDPLPRLPPPVLPASPPPQPKVTHGPTLLPPLVLPPVALAPVHQPPAAPTNNVPSTNGSNKQINVYTPPPPHVEPQTHVNVYTPPVQPQTHEPQTHVNVYTPPVQPQTHVNVYKPPVQPQSHVNVYTPASKGSGATSPTGHVNSTPLSSGRVNVTPRVSSPVRTAAPAKPQVYVSQGSSRRR